MGTGELPIRGVAHLVRRPGRPHRLHVRQHVPHAQGGLRHVQGRSAMRVGIIKESLIEVRHYSSSEVTFSE